MVRTRTTKTAGRRKPTTINEQQSNKNILTTTIIGDDNEQLKTADQLEPLVDQAERFLISSEFDRARKVCQEVLNILPHHLKALETLALCELELGEIKSARKLFLKCLNHSKPNPPPTVYLYLAQLSDSPEQALKYYEKALELLKSNLKQILESKNLINDQNGIESNPNPRKDDTESKTIDEDDNTGADHQPITLRWSTDESQIRRSCSRALVGMTEIYLTDLCFDPSAEEKCLEYLSMASSIDPTDPEPLQTLASVRLSQSETELAKEALLLSWSLWRDKVRSDKPSVIEENLPAMGNDEEEVSGHDLDRLETNKVEDHAGEIKEDEDEGAGNQTIDSMMIEEEVVIEEERSDDGEQDTNLPPLETRIQWAKLAIECEMWNSVIEVLHQCEAEDDENGEIEYLLALSWYLLGRSRLPDSTDCQSNPIPTPTPNHHPPHQSNDQSRSIVRDYSVAAGDGLGSTECWLEAKECIETCFQLYERLGDSSEIDESILKHLKEMKVELDRAGIPNQQDRMIEEGEGEEIVDEDQIEDADWVDVSDVEMG